MEKKGIITCLSIEERDLPRFRDTCKNYSVAIIEELPDEGSVRVVATGYQLYAIGYSLGMQFAKSCQPTGITN